MQQKMITVTLTISTNEQTAGKAWQILGKLNAICNDLEVPENALLTQIREHLAIQLEESGYIPF